MNFVIPLHVDPRRSFCPRLASGVVGGVAVVGVCGLYTGIEMLRGETLSLWEWSERGVGSLLGPGVIGRMHGQMARRRAEMEERLNRLNPIYQRWSAALESNGDGLWDWDGERRTCFYSSTGKAMIGSRGQGFPPTPEVWLARIHPDYFARVLTSVVSSPAHEPKAHPVAESDHLHARQITTHPVWPWSKAVPAGARARREAEFFADSSR